MSANKDTQEALPLVSGGQGRSAMSVVQAAVVVGLCFAGIVAVVVVSLLSRAA